MESTVIKKKLKPILALYQDVTNILDAIHSKGGISYLVGGTVRDLILDYPIKDLDIEVHKISLEELQKILSEFGYVNLVGKSFGVLKLQGLDVDWSVPRTDKAGRKPEVIIDPAMDIAHAFERRDVTMNAMGINLKDFQLVDPFGGLQDIKDKILRAPSPSLFIEDPLRFYRVMQFIARFEMKPDRELDKLCSLMDISEVAQERIESEFKKWLLLSKRPSLSLRWLDSIGRLTEIMPEIAATKGILQEPDWHPEGDVFEHLLQTLDASAVLEYESQEKKLSCMYAALCHDIGKTTTTRLLQGRLRSHNHAQVGARLAHTLMKRITRNHELIKTVVKLVDAHMHPPLFVKDKAGMAAYKRLARKLAPEVSLRMLAKVSMADRQGRNPLRNVPLATPVPELEKFIQRAQEAGVLDGCEGPVLQGKDLMPEVEPGEHMGFLLKKAYELQLEKDITDKNELKKLVLKKYNDKTLI